MWIVKIALNRPYTFIVLALLILLISPLVISCPVPHAPWTGAAVSSSACRLVPVPDTSKAAADAIAARVFPVPIKPGIVVSGFMPLKTEINPLPLMKTLADAGATLALPKIARRGQPLIMRAWPWGAPLDTGQWGIREPKADSPEVEPDILLVPLLAFDRSGQRIGYGAGYYDMTIHRL